MPLCMIEGLLGQQPAVEEDLAGLFVATGAMASLRSVAFHLLGEKPKNSDRCGDGE
jgi:hypothetical protein